MRHLVDVLLVAEVGEVAETADEAECCHNPEPTALEEDDEHSNQQNERNADSSEEKRLVADRHRNHGRSFVGVEVGGGGRHG